MGGQPPGQTGVSIIEASRSAHRCSPSSQVSSSGVLYAFPSQEEFVRRHEEGTLIEMKNEEKILTRFNSKKELFKAWVISAMPNTTNAFYKSWLVLVKPPPPSVDSKFPSLTDRVHLDFQTSIVRDEGTFTLIHLPATRIINPFDETDRPVDGFLKRCAAFKVDVARSFELDEVEHKDLDLMAHFQVTSAIDSISAIDLSDDKAQLINIEFDVNSITFDAELAALRYLVEDKRLSSRCPSPRSLLAFHAIQNFSGEKTYTNLFKIYPHIANPVSSRLPRLLVDKFKAQSVDHRNAHVGLQRIVNGLYFVNGCPGAGKTEWNILLAALIQSKTPPHRNRRGPAPILFLVDLNATVDSAADRYYNLCKEAGMKRHRVIRMHGWPYELRNSSKLQGAAENEDEEDGPDFTKRFLMTAGLQDTTLKRSRDKAPTLDEAAWEYYEHHKEHCDLYGGLQVLLRRMDAGEIFNNTEWKSLRSVVGMLYRAVLKNAHFIATTPTAIYGSFTNLFKPEVVFIDEAPHARELTTLIPIAYLDPFVWIFTGDVNQTRPFVKGGDKRDMKREGLDFNPHAEQLRLSTMARADVVGAIKSKLLENQRARANLHRLPSKLFYEGLMTSSHSEKDKYPPSTRYLQQYLETLGRRQGLKENRVVVSLEQSAENTESRSFWNPAHHKWILSRAHDLLDDPKFLSLNSAPGTVMIQTPYKTAFRQYEAYVKQWSPDKQERVQVVTVDKAQGNQADVVFLDMVRTKSVGFMDEPQRLNVAITRAKQAEIIVMHKAMTYRYPGLTVKSRFVSQIWNDAEGADRLFKLSNEPQTLE
jgi:hypothetical protein